MCGINGSKNNCNFKNLQIGKKLEFNCCTKKDQICFLQSRKCLSGYFELFTTTPVFKFIR